MIRSPISMLALSAIVLDSGLHWFSITFLTVKMRQYSLRKLNPILSHFCSLSMMLSKVLSHFGLPNVNYSVIHLLTLRLSSRVDGRNDENCENGHKQLHEWFQRMMNE